MYDVRLASRLQIVLNVRVMVFVQNVLMDSWLLEADVSRVIQSVKLAWISPQSAPVVMLDLRWRMKIAMNVVLIKVLNAFLVN